MLPAKSRERKCSTCRHYQASPLWRKGWCRNPLLYDRNTNHLVEADSLACNRTFIDYWEPITEGSGPAGSSTRAGKPRIAPSIPLQAMDAQGRPVQEDVDEESAYVTDDLRDERDTPVSGVRAPGPKPLFRPTTTERQRPPLALVDDDYDDLLGDPNETTDLVSQDRPIERTKPSPAVRESARERIARARQSRMPKVNLPQLSGIPLYAAVAGLAVLLVIVAALFIFNRGGTVPNGVPDGVPTVQSSPQPTPTGFGDPTPTGVPGVVPPAQSPSVRTDVIAVGGYVVVNGTGDGLIVRNAPTRSGSRIAKLTDGTKARVVDGPRVSDGFTWWKIDNFDRGNTALTGWSVQDYLKPTTP